MAGTRTLSNTACAFKPNDIFSERNNGIISVGDIVSMRQFAENMSLDTIPSMESIESIQNILFGIKNRIEGTNFRQHFIYFSETSRISLSKSLIFINENNNYNQPTGSALAQTEDMELVVDVVDQSYTSITQDENTAMLLSDDSIRTRSNIQQQRRSKTHPERLQKASVKKPSCKRKTLNVDKKQPLRSLRKNRHAPARLVYKRRSKEKLDQAELRRREIWHMKKSRRYSSMRQNLQTRIDA